MRYCGTRANGWDIFLLELANLTAMPAHLELPSPHFVCLLALDARNASKTVMPRLANDLLQTGLVFLCTWGPDCQRFSHVFENVAIQYDLTAGREHPVTVNVSFENDSLDTALDFFQSVCYPNPMFEKTCRTGVIIPIGHAKLATYIHQQVTQTDEAHIG